MSERYLCRELTWGACSGKWNFSTWQADVVTINLGTNDYVFGHPTPDQFQKAYDALITLVRDKYPNALIACLQPLIYTCFGNDEKWQNAVARIQAAVASRGDEKVRFYRSGSPSSPWLVCSQDYSDWTHPNTRGNRKLAEGLLSEMTTDVRRFFPEKCGGAGKRCAKGTSSPSQAVIPTPLSAPSAMPSHSPLPSITSASPTSTPTRMPTLSMIPCRNKMYDQCGGKVFSGDTCCPSGTRCMASGEWWSHCEPCSPTSDGNKCSGSMPNPLASPRPTPGPSSTSSVTSCSKQKYEQCDGKYFGGKTCCPTGMWCMPSGGEWWSQCQPCIETWDASCGV